MRLPTYGLRGFVDGGDVGAGPVFNQDAPGHSIYRCLCFL
jgi:hypothetical protein